MNDISKSILFINKNRPTTVGYDPTHPNYSAKTKLNSLIKPKDYISHVIKSTQSKYISSDSINEESLIEKNFLRGS